MNPFKAMVNRLLASALAGAAFLTFIGAGSAGAQVVMLRVPGDSPGAPVYARTDSPAGRPFVYHTDEWAAIVFYRTPGCVPSGFNLLQFFDLPGAFACPLTVSGFELWENGPPIDSAPRGTNLSGLAVPVWFVPWPILQAAIADNILTMPELELLAPLKGIATTFHELLHPIGGPTGATGGAKVPHLTITASGFLPDGRLFQYQFNAVETNKPANNVRIVFR